MKGLVTHEGFERLPHLDLIRLALTMNTLTGSEVFVQAQFDRRGEAQLRDAVRSFFEIKTVPRTPLPLPEMLNSKPLWSIEVDGYVKSLSVSADEKRIAAGFQFGPARLFDAGTRQLVKVLGTGDAHTLVHFPQSGGQLLCLDCRGAFHLGSDCTAET